MHARDSKSKRSFGSHGDRQGQVSLSVFVRLLCFAACCSALTACTSVNTDYSRQGASILVGGVVPENSQLSSPYKALWIDQIEQSMQAQSRYPFLRYTDSQRILGDFHSTVVNDYADDGVLRATTRDALRRSQWPARYLFLVYLHEAEDERRATSSLVRNRQGELINDRVSTTFIRSREHVVTGSVFDLSSGERVWHRSYQANPQTERTYTRYRGSSFAGSVAALLANRLVNGQSNTFPDPPPNGQVIRELASELVYQLFNGAGHL